MKNLKIVFLLLAGIPFYSQAQLKKSFIINGSLTNMTVKPAKIYLNYDAITKKPADSAVINDGKYTFRGNVEASVIAALSFDLKAPQDKLNIMLDNGVLNINSDQSLANAKVTGSGSTANNEFLKVTSITLNESAAIKKMMESEAYKTDDAVKKQVQYRSGNLLGNALNNMIIYARKNPKSPASPYFIYALIGSGLVTPEMSDTLYRIFPANLKSSQFALAIDSALAKRKQAKLDAAATQKIMEGKAPLGSKAHEFTQKDTDGKMVSLSSFKGKYVLIDFWASWCVPCRAENPNLVKAFNAFKDKGFTVLGVSLDGRAQKDNWLEAIKKDGLDWTQVSELNGFENIAAKLYGIQSIPQNFLIDPNGVIVAKNLRGEELMKKLTSIFK